MNALNLSGFLSWTIDDLSSELESIGFEDEAELFRSNEISGDLLPYLTEDHLKEMGIHETGPRLLIWKFICDTISTSTPSKASTPVRTEQVQSTAKSRDTSAKTTAKISATVPPATNEENVPKYKRDHDKMVENIRAARKYAAYMKAVDEGRAVGPPPELPPIEEPEGLVQCPNCGRKFGEEAASRHIPVCERMNARRQASRGGKR